MLGLGWLRLLRALLLAYAVRMSRSDWVAVLAAAVRTPLAAFAGVMVASLFAGVVDRESQLFRFFRSVDWFEETEQSVGLFGRWLGDGL